MEKSHFSTGFVIKIHSICRRIEKRCACRYNKITVSHRGMILMNPRENYLAIMRHEKPEWVPVYAKPVRFNIGFDEVFERGPAEGGLDGFGVTWARDSMGGVPTSENLVLEDVTQWREKVRFPDLDSIDWAAKAQRELQGVDRSVQCVEYCMANGPFERMVALMTYQEFIYALLDEPEACHELLDAYAEYRIHHIELVAQHYRPDFISIFDDCAYEDGPFLSHALYQEFISPIHKRCNDAIKAHGILPIQHCCGKADSLAEDFIAEGAIAWSSVQASNDIEGVLRKHAKDIVIIGGFDTNGAPAQLDATEQQRRAEVRRCIDTYAPYGSYMISNLIVQGPTKEKTIEYNRQLMDEALNYGRAFYQNTGAGR